MEFLGHRVSELRATSCRRQSRHPAAKVYRIVAEPEGGRGGKLSSPPLLRYTAPELALGSHLCVALSSAQAYSSLTSGKASCKLSRSLSRRLTASSGFGELAITLREDPLLQSIEFIRWRNVADDRMQAARIVVLHVLGDLLASFLDGFKTTGANTLPLDGPVPTLQLPVALRIVRTRPQIKWTGCYCCLGRIS